MQKVRRQESANTPFQDEATFPSDDGPLVGVALGHTAWGRNRLDLSWAVSKLQRLEQSASIWRIVYYSRMECVRGAGAPWMVGAASDCAYHEVRPRAARCAALCRVSRNLPGHDPGRTDTQ